MLAKSADLAVLLLGAAAFRSTSYMIQTTIPLYAGADLHGSSFVISLIATVSTIAGICSYLYAGFRIRNLRRAALASFVILCASLALMLVVSNIASLTAVAVVLNATTGGLALMLVTLAATEGNLRDRERNVKLFTAALSFGLLFGPLYQALALWITNSNLVYSMVLFIPLVAAASALFYRAKPSTHGPQMRKGPDLSFFKNRLFLLGVLSNATFGLPLVVVLTFGGIFAKSNLGADYFEIQLLFSLFFLASLSMRLLYVRLAPKKFSAMLACIAMAISGLLLLFLSRSFPEALPGALILGVAHGISYPVATNYIADAVPVERLAGANSISFFLSDVSTSACLPVIGALSLEFGLQSVFALTIIPVAFFSSGYLLLSRRIPVLKQPATRFIRE